MNTRVVDLNQSRPASPHSHRSEADRTDSSPGEPFNGADFYRGLSNLSNEAVRDISLLAKSCVDTQQETANINRKFNQLMALIANPQSSVYNPSNHTRAQADSISAFPLTLEMNTARLEHGNPQSNILE